MSALAAIRPDAVDLPLFLHVAGAMLLGGILFTVATAVGIGRRREADAPALTRFALLTLLAGAVPAYLLMRIGAEWTLAREDLPEEVEDEAWLGVGYVVADVGVFLILLATILAVIGLRSLRAGGGLVLGRAVGIISSFLLLAYLVAVWAMSAKPA